MAKVYARISLDGRTLDVHSLPEFAHRQWEKDMKVPFMSPHLRVSRRDGAPGEWSVTLHGELVGSIKEKYEDLLEAH